MRRWAQIQSNRITNCSVTAVMLPEGADAWCFGPYAGGSGKTSGGGGGGRRGRGTAVQSPVRGELWLGTEVLKESTQSWGSVDEMTQQGRSREPHRRFCVLSRLLDALKDLRQREGVM